MGICTSKPSPNSTLFSPVAIQAKDNSIPTNDTAKPDPTTASLNDHTNKTTVEPVKKSPLFPFYSPSPAHRFFFQEVFAGENSGEECGQCELNAEEVF